MTCPRPPCKSGMEPGFKVGRSGPSFGPVCDRYWRHREWDPDAGKTWTWDPSPQSCEDCFHVVSEALAMSGAALGTWGLWKAGEGSRGGGRGGLCNASPPMSH